MGLRLLAALVALLSTLSLTVPTAWAAPRFDSADLIDHPVVFATSPGSGCTLPTDSANSFVLPEADSTKAITYTITNGTCDPETTCGLPNGVTFDPDTRTLSGDPATIAKQAAKEYFYFAHDADGNNALSFTLEIVNEKDVLQTFYRATGGANWTTQTGWDTANTCPDGGLHGVTVTDGRVSALVFVRKT